VSPPPSPTVTITAVSTADSAATASAQVTITSAPGGHSGGGAFDVFTLLMSGALLGTLRLQRRRVAMRRVRRSDAGRAGGREEFDRAPVCYTGGSVE
jgi:hypothetical protein